MTFDNINHSGNIAVANELFKINCKGDAIKKLLSFKINFGTLSGPHEEGCFSSGIAEFTSLSLI